MKTKIKTFSATFGFCLFINVCANAQPNLEWVKQTAGLSDDAGNSVSIDNIGNVYVTGYFAGMADFDPGPALYPLSASGGKSAFIYKQDLSGNLIWAKNFSGYSRSNFIAIVDSGYLYVTGTFNGTVDFDLDTGIFNLTSLGGTADIFICKLDTAGNFIWAKSFGDSNTGDGGYKAKIDPSGNVLLLATEGGPSTLIIKLDASGNVLWNFELSTVYGYSMEVDLSGNVLFTGMFSGTVDFDPGPGTFNLFSSAGPLFICKWNSTGNFIWAKNMAAGSGNYESSNSIVVDGINNIYITGEFSDTADFDPGPGIFNLLATGGRNSFVSKYDALGNFLWAGALQGYSSSGYELTLDNIGNMLITGYFGGIVDFDPSPGVFNLITTGSSDIFVCKLNNAGNFIWAANMGGLANDIGYSVCSDAVGNIYTTGLFYGVADFDPKNGVFNLTPEAAPNIFISKLDNSGNFGWAKSIVGSKVTIGQSDVDAAGNIYTTGGFEGTSDFDPDSGITFLNYAGNQDAYVRKINSAGNLEWAKSFGGPSEDDGKIIATHNTGNVYLTLYFNDTVDFDPGPGIYNLTATLYGSTCIVKLDSNGNFTWAKMVNPLEDMEVDAAGNIYLTGGFGGIVDFDPGPGVYNLITSYDSLWGYNYDLYVLKLNASGDFQWARSIGDSIDGDYGDYIAIDGTGNIYLSGYFGSAADFDPGPAVYNLSNTCSPSSAYILKLTAAGNFVWAKSFDCYGTGLSYMEAPVLFARNNGNLYMTGGYWGTMDFDPGPGVDTLTATFNDFSDMYIVKLNSTGNFVWKRSIETDYNHDLRGLSIASDNSGNVFAAGIKNGNTGATIRICGITSAGGWLWNSTVNGPFNVSYNGPCAVGTDQYDNLYFSGVFENPNDFDFTAGVYNVSASGKVDIFMSKYAGNNPACSTAPTSIISNGINNSICSGQQVTLTQNGGVLSQNGNFYWYADSCGGTLLGTGASINFSPTDTTTYYVRAEDSCGVTSCVSKTIKVKPPASPPTITGNGLFCQGSSIVLDAGSGYSAYQWSTGSTVQSATVYSAGLYSVTITIANGCTANAGVTVTVFPDPPAAITPSSNINICLGDTVLFVATSGAGYLYQWLKNSVPITGAINSFYNAISNGYFSCSITDSNFCESISDSVKVTIVCVPPDDPELRIANGLPGEIAVVPNPAVEFVVVSPVNSGSSGESGAAAQTEITIKDVLGNLVLKIPNAVFPAKINVGGFSKGIYFISLQTEKEFLTTKFSKQ